MAQTRPKNKKPVRKSSSRTAARSPKPALHAARRKAGKRDKPVVARKLMPATKPIQFPKRKPTAAELAHQQALARFSSGLEFMNQSQFARARAIFERLKDNPSRELAERARVYLHICQQRSARPSLHLKTIDELYDYAVSLANEGQHVQAEEHLRKALKMAPKADFLYYALAATFALRNDVEGTLEYLDKAIQIDERNRFHAQNDPDFEAMLEDPRFTELIYPERPLV